MLSVSNRRRVPYENLINQQVITQWRHLMQINLILQRDIINLPSERFSDQCTESLRPNPFKLAGKRGSLAKQKPDTLVILAKEQGAWQMICRCHAECYLNGTAAGAERLRWGACSDEETGRDNNNVEVLHSNLLIFHRQDFSSSFFKNYF